MRKLITIAIIILFLPGLSQAKSLEELLVEKGLITKSEMRASSHHGGAKVYWNGGTRLDFADAGFTTKINTQLQTRYEFTDNESGDNTSSFSIRRARLQMSGTALHEEFSYKVQIEFANGEGDLRDAFIGWHACDWASLRMGQFKTAISRQYNTTSSKLQFADRSDVSNNFDLGRQQGLAAIGSVMDDRVMLRAGIFNGISDGEGRNGEGVDTNHTGEVSARADLVGSMNAYEEGDVNHSDGSNINAGVSYAYSDANTGEGLVNDLELSSLSADINYKGGGLSFHGEFFYQDVEIADGTVLDTDHTGFYAQIGYFVKPKKWEVAGRYGFLDCDDGSSGGLCSGNDDINSVDATLNYYWWKHNLKAQIGFAFLEENPQGGGSSTETTRWLLQISSYF